MSCGNNNTPAEKSTSVQIATHSTLLCSPSTSNGNCKNNSGNEKPSPPILLSTILYTRAIEERTYFSTTLRDSQLGRRLPIQSFFQKQSGR
ncbi:hypothetical protein K457DRAFT_134865 [Linnemannia elongata AG-77]|uniref:Uncharacterized protein n=1 Tax=Linnemannia elongata AG-77 TaxID=1314771 RepID=A0A197K7S2_9FUNG|nr:hypothetical protein K457DRAFT_134865 [Linnemannia elongata AG-77]